MMAKPKPKQQRKIASVSTSTVSSVASSRMPSRASSPSPPRKPFRFFDLPSELRLRIYEDLLLMDEVVDLNPLNYHYIYPRLAVFLVSHRMHEEAYRVFYSQTIRLYPYHGRFFHTKNPLLQRLPVRYREVINSLELRLGPGWSSPPRSQNTHPRLGLFDCTSLRTLKILVECDPSDATFNGFRGKNATEETYKWFCVDLLQGIMEQAPSLETVELDAWSAKKDQPLVQALKRKAEGGKKRVVWNPARNWLKEQEEPALKAIEDAMAAMGVSNETPRSVAIQA